MKSFYRIPSNLRSTFLVEKWNFECLEVYQDPHFNHLTFLESSLCLLSFFAPSCTLSVLSWKNSNAAALLQCLEGPI